jgi:hypothetical protein
MLGVASLAEVRQVGPGVPGIGLGGTARQDRSGRVRYVAARYVGACRGKAGFAAAWLRWAGLVFVWQKWQCTAGSGPAWFGEEGVIRQAC